MQCDPRWGGRYAHALGKLYLVVQAIDGEGLASAESQVGVWARGKRGV